MCQLDYHFKLYMTEKWKFIRFEDTDRVDILKLTRLTYYLDQGSAPGT